MKKLIPILILLCSCRSVKFDKTTVTETDDLSSQQTLDSNWKKKHVNWSDLFQAGNVHVHIGLTSDQKAPSKTPVIPGKDPLSQLIEAAIKATGQTATSIDFNVGSLTEKQSFETSEDSGHLKTSSNINTHAVTEVKSKHKETTSGVGIGIVGAVFLLFALVLYFVNQYFSTGRKAVETGIDLVKKL